MQFGMQRRTFRCSCDRIFVLSHQPQLWPSESKSRVSSPLAESKIPHLTLAHCHAMLQALIRSSTMKPAKKAKCKASCISEQPIYAPSPAPAPAPAAPAPAVTSLNTSPSPVPQAERNLAEYLDRRRPCLLLASGPGCRALPASPPPGGHRPPRSRGWVRPAG